MLDVDVVPRTYAFGKLIEAFIVAEVFRQNDYFETNYALSYLRTKDDMEIDLILDKPGQPTSFIEIKSTDHVDLSDLRSLRSVHKVNPNDIFMVWSLEKSARMVDGIFILPWQEGLKKVFG